MRMTIEKSMLQRGYVKRQKHIGPKQFLVHQRKFIPFIVFARDYKGKCEKVTSVGLRISNKTKARRIKSTW